MSSLKPLSDQLHILENAISEILKILEPGFCAPPSEANEVDRDIYKSQLIADTLFECFMCRDSYLEMDEEGVRKRILSVLLTDRTALGNAIAVFYRTYKWTPESNLDDKPLFHSPENEGNFFRMSKKIAYWIILTICMGHTFFISQYFDSLKPDYDSILLATNEHGLRCVVERITENWARLSSLFLASDISPCDYMSCAQPILQGA